VRAGQGGSLARFGANGDGGLGGALAVPVHEPHIAPSESASDCQVQSNGGLTDPAFGISNSYDHWHSFEIMFF